jgi:hypothetical protein
VLAFPWLIRVAFTEPAAVFAEEAFHRIILDAAKLWFNPNSVVFSGYGTQPGIDLF